MTLTFVSAFLQIFFIAVQTKNIAESAYVLAFLTSLGISLTWIVNANSVVKRGWKERIAYACGSATGVVAGIFLYDKVFGGK